MARKIELMIQTQEGLNSCVIVPAEHLEQFREMVRRGLAHEWGQHPHLYKFADELFKGWTPEKKVTIRDGI